MKKQSKRKSKKSFLPIIIALILLVFVPSLFSKDGDGNGITEYSTQISVEDSTKQSQTETGTKKEEIFTTASSSVSSERFKVDLKSIPKFKNKPYTVINNNVPTFSKNIISDKDYEYYAPLDSLGRCTYAVASVGKKLMPTEKRGAIGSVKPTGWHTVKYDFVDGKYLYNRCHLIGYQLSGENANRQNLITGTRYLNVEGMLPFENMVADYVKETNNHVMYRVTPVYDGNDLLATGVQMEAYSVEDDGDGICFNVFCYNVQPGVKIDYSTGESE